METPLGERRVCDAHVHFFSRRFLESLAAQSGKNPEQVAATVGWELPPEDPAELARRWAAELDGNGVARSALMASMPGDEGSVAAALAACPGRFFGYFMFNPLEPDAAGRARAAFASGLQVVCLFPAMHRYSMHDSRVEAVLQEAAAQPHRAVFVHCGVLTVGVRKKLGLPSPFDMRYSNPLDLHAIALRYPKLAFIVPHFGAGLFREALMLAELCANVYLDTSSSNSWMRYEDLDLKTVFSRALAVAGPGRLLFGTDSSFFPRGWNRSVFDEQARMFAALDLSPGDTRLIFGENLERILCGSALSS
jgi:predicted TIM-barrel fold metal-dependent hydrolase